MINKNFDPIPPDQYGGHYLVKALGGDMTDDKVKNTARVIHTIVCSQGEPHDECGPDARNHFPIERAIAEWHLKKIEPLVEALEKIKQEPDNICGGCNLKGSFASHALEFYQSGELK